MTETRFTGTLTQQGEEVTTPEDSGYSYEVSYKSQPKQEGGVKSAFAQQEEMRRARLKASWAQHDAQKQAAIDGAWKRYQETNQEYAKRREARQEGWKKGDFTGMKSITTDLWNTLGKRDGGYTEQYVLDENGNRKVNGTNPDGSPKFEVNYHDNGGAKFDKDDNGGTIDRLNRWWTDGGGSVQMGGAVPKGVFGKDGKLDVSKIKTQDQLNALVHIMNDMQGGMARRRNQAYVNLNQRQIQNLKRTGELEGRDRDMQYLANKGALKSADFDSKTGERILTDSILRDLAQRYRMQDALEAVEGYEDYVQENGEDDVSAVMKNHMINTAREAGIKTSYYTYNDGKMSVPLLAVSTGLVAKREKQMEQEERKEQAAEQRAQEKAQAKARADAARAQAEKVDQQARERSDREFDASVQEEIDHMWATARNGRRPPKGEPEDPELSGAFDRLEKEMESGASDKKEGPGETSVDVSKIRRPVDPGRFTKARDAVNQFHDERKTVKELDDAWAAKSWAVSNPEPSAKEPTRAKPRAESEAQPVWTPGAANSHYNQVRDMAESPRENWAAAAQVAPYLEPAAERPAKGGPRRDSGDQPDKPPTPRAPKARARPAGRGARESVGKGGAARRSTGH